MQKKIGLMMSQNYCNGPFKNIVDDFYLKYLDKEYIIADVFMVQGDKGK